MLPALAVLFALAPVLPACSLPRFDASQPRPSRTVAQLIESNHYRQALAEFTAASKEAPSGLAADDLLLARIQLGFGQLEPAMALIEKRLAVDPQNAQLHVEAAAAAGRMAEHAGMLKQISLAKRVRKELDSALAIEPGNADAIYGLVLYADLAPSFLGGDKAQAQKLAEQLTALDPPRGYLAQARLAQDRHDAAAEEAFLKKAIEAGPRSYDAHLAYAIFHQKSGPAHSEQADEFACQSLYLDPTRAEAWQILAELCASEGCVRDVEGLIAAEQEFIPDDLSPAYFAALGFLEANTSLGYAESLIRMYLAKPQEGGAPSSGLARYQLALIQEKQGRWAEALDSLHIALQEEPTLDKAKQEAKRLEKSGRQE